VTVELARSFDITCDQPLLCHFHGDNLLHVGECIKVWRPPLCLPLFLFFKPKWQVKVWCPASLSRSLSLVLTLPTFRS
jgi:hypothetical protein